MTCPLMGRNSILLSVALKERRDLVTGTQDCLSCSGVDEDECSFQRVLTVRHDAVV